MIQCSDISIAFQGKIVLDRISLSICVKVGKPYNIMGSYNKINSFWNYYNYDLDTTILRGQWGWTGSLMTDWWAREGASDALQIGRAHV